MNPLVTIINAFSFIVALSFSTGLLETMRLIARFVYN